MMLPLLCSLPREGLVFFIASEACLTARKHLQKESAVRQSEPYDVTYESALIRILSINNFESMSARNLLDAKPAYYSGLAGC